MGKTRRATTRRSHRAPNEWCAHDDCIEPPQPGSKYCADHLEQLRDGALREKGIFAGANEDVIVCPTCNTPRPAGEETCTNCEQARDELQSHIETDLSIFDL